MSTRAKLQDSAYLCLMRPNSPWNKTAEERALMTIACHDADEIPRVSDAGTSKKVDGVDVQIMHNGLKVKKNGYQGMWQAHIIESLKGVHEPQEEKVFFEVLKRIKQPEAMIELGSWWSYYSMWYLKEKKGSKAICCEPDPVNISLGKENMRLNGFESEDRSVFYNVASGAIDDKRIKFTTEAGDRVSVLTKTIDSIITEQQINKLDILHMDIQGAEMDALKSAQRSIAKGKIRFVFISTHHYSISNNPTIHQDCIEFIKKHRGHIIASHNVLESCSGDGLIVASFDDRDKDFSVEVSVENSQESLFRPYEQDIKILWDSYDKLLKYTKKIEANNNVLTTKLNEQEQHVRRLGAELDEIGHLKKHIQRQIRIKARKIIKK